MTSVWGKKIGMTQLFVGDKVIPVTAIDVSNWVITNIKTKERDGYDAVQVGLTKKRFQQKPFSPEWLKKLTTYFSVVREVSPENVGAELTIGQPIDLATIMKEGNKLHVTGATIGRGFQGTMKRHDFNGSPGSHGSTIGRRPGSLSFMRSRGRVIKGKRLPGHMGAVQRMTKNLEVVKFEHDAQVVLVSGSIPGKSGSLVFIKKA